MSGWREPMVWLMLAIPAATVVAGVATWRVARADGALDAVPEAVARVAQVQVADTHADEAAAARGLRATLEVGADGRWTVAGVDAHRLTLVHPTRARDDLAWTRLDGRWSGPAVPRHAHGRVVLEGDGWRLVGRWRPDATRVELHPAVAAR
jgi:hypothetical protein